MRDYVGELERLKPRVSEFALSLAAEKKECAALRDEVSRLRAALSAGEGRPAADGAAEKTIAELQQSNAALREKLAAAATAASAIATSACWSVSS